MASITYTERAGGRIRAQVREKRAGRVIASQARTFSNYREASAWAMHVKKRFETGDLATPSAPNTLEALIVRYCEEFGSLARFGRTKRSDLQRLRGYNLADRPVLELRAPDYVEHIRKRRLAGASAATAKNDLTWIRIVLKAARAAWGLPVTLQELDDAIHYLTAQGLIGRAARRARRPTAEELARLREYFDRQDGRSEIPMREIVDFAIASTRRQAEITRLLWADNDPKELTGLVRDLKHPREKDGNHRRFKYTAEAWEIATRQPRKAAEIFPYNPKSIGARFTRACHVLEIADLHFHDLRHEGISRLFERGHSIVEVQLFSLHESWAELARYTQIRPGHVQNR